MTKNKIKKLPIILPLVLLVIILALYTVMNNRGATAASSLSMGQQYLNKLDYGGAIAAFTRAVELDPNNTEARVGLAEAYAGLGEYEFAEEVLGEMVYTTDPDESATLALLDVYKAAGDDAKGLQLVQILINNTDKDEYYQMRSEILAELFDRPRSVAAGIDHAIRIDGGRVLGRGGNNFGQLGTEPASEYTDSFTAAGFSGTAVKVACFGRTSLVIDSEGRLWAAGENRWGQQGGGYADLSAEGGWTEIILPAKAADVAGTAGRMFVLLNDGSLWQAGGGDLSELSLVGRFGTVAAISASAYDVMILTADGELWRSSSYAPDEWYRLAGNVATFGLSESGSCWIDTDGYIGNDYAYIYLPDDWYDGMSYMCPYKNVSSMVVVDGVLLLQTGDGKMFAVSEGTASEISLTSPAVNVYALGYEAFIEHEDGSVSFITGRELTPRSIDEY